MVAIARTRTNVDGDKAVLQVQAEDDLTDHLQEARDAETTWRFGGLTALLFLLLAVAVLLGGIWAGVTALGICLVTSIMATMAVSGQDDPEAGKSQKRGG